MTVTCIIRNGITEGSIHLRFDHSPKCECELRREREEKVRLEAYEKNGLQYVREVRDEV